MTASIIYVTTSSKDEALNIGRILVEEHLVACINVLDGMTSVYRWEGKVEQANECVLIVKARKDLFAKISQRIKELHSYSCPCVISWNIDQGDKSYLDWLTSS